MDRSRLSRAWPLLTFAAGLLGASFGLAQTSPVPRLNAVFPTGGQAGTTFELKVTGQDLGKVEGLHFSFPGVQAEPVGEERKADKPAKAPKGMKKQGGPRTTQTFRVTLPAGAPLGVHDVRLVASGGISNPRAFVVGDVPESVEKEPNDDAPKAQPIELNRVVHGVINSPTDVDYYAFAGKQGQRVVVSVLASTVDSKLPAAVEVYSAAGKPLGMNRNYDGSNALLDVTLPADGEYLVRVFSFTYTQGGPDYFYRLAAGTMPWIDAVFPPTVEPGKEAELTVYGRNLPGGELDPASVVDGRVLERARVKVKAPADGQRLAYSGLITPPAALLDGFDFRLRNKAGSSNPYLLTFARAPVVLDNEKNDTRDTAQQVPVPGEVAGRIEKRGDADWYAFTAKKGQLLSLEAYGERIGAPLDLFFQIVNEKGNVLTEQDDVNEVPAPQFFARTDDPALPEFKVPADGTYFVRITSRGAFTEAGPRHLYKLTLTEQAPDFRLVAMPMAPQTPDAGQLGQSGAYAYTVFVLPLGGFAGNVALTGVDLPPGVTVPPQVIGRNQKQAALVVRAGPDARPWAGPLKVVGTATVGGKKLVRAVRGATITWPLPQQQNNTPTVTRLDRELVLAVRDKAPYTLTAGTDKVKVLQGEKVSVPLKLKANWSDFKGTVQVTALGLPKGVTAQPLSLTPGKDGTAVIAGKGNQQLPPGNYTLVLRGQTQPISMKPQPQKAGGPPNYIQVTQPIALTVVPKQLAKLSVAPTPAKVQPGKQTELTVRLARQYDLPVPFKVEAVVPKDAKGIAVQGTTVGERQDEAKLVITATPQARPGTSVPVVIRATGLFNGDVPVVHETKLNVNVTK